jgi:cytochrome c-type biogenesis protein CcmH
LPETKRLTGLLPCAVLLVSLLSLGAGGDYEKAVNTILCDCGCHPQSVHDCACSRAEQMRQEIAAEVRGGKTGDQVIADHVAQSGEKVRIVPTKEGFNLLAWLGPGVGFLGAIVFVALVLSRWRRRATPAEPADVAVASPEDPYQKRLDRELEEYR